MGYGAQQTEFFLILDHFLPFYTPSPNHPPPPPPPRQSNNPENQNFEKMKKTGYHHFTQEYQKLWLDDVRSLRYGARTDGRTDWKSDI